MKIVADKHILFLKGVLEPYAEVVYLQGNQITNEDIRDADALIVRTRTLCNAELLENTQVQFVGSATIGQDHLDTNWMDEHAIKWANAPGCNADSVEQYVSSALLRWMHQHRVSPEEMTIAIVGVGQVGSRVAKSCEYMGMKVLLNDPPRERAEGSAQFTPMKEILDEADIISFHVPLTRSGADQTHQLVNEELIRQMNDETLLINTCRGEVFETRSVIKAINTGKLLPPIIDCWEHEPHISIRFLDRAYIGTPHIAGYSQEGKANGTKQILHELAKHFDLPLENWVPNNLPDPEVNYLEIEGQSNNPTDILRAVIHHTYPIWEDDELLRSHPLLFEDLRGNYRMRRQYEAYQIEGKNLTEEQKELLQKFRFNIIED